jgi:hypothetical protein
LPDRSRQKTPGPPSKAREPSRPKHVADEPLPEPAQPDAGVQPAVTETGLPVEEQVEKEWDPKKDGGLPTFLRSGRK